MGVYAEVHGAVVVQYPYTIGSLMAENPYTSYTPDVDVAAIFPATETAISQGYTLEPVAFAPQPSFDPATQVCNQNALPVLKDGVWTLDWTVVDMDADQKAEYQSQVQSLNKDQAQKLLLATDWSEIPSVTDTAHNPHLANAADFVAYRVALRAIAVNPPTTPATFPTLPSEQWSSSE